MSDNVTIRISRKTHDFLINYGKKSETLDDILTRIISKVTGGNEILA